MSVNKKIAEYLRIKGVSQKEFAEMLNTNQPNLSRILNSDDMKVSQLEEMAKLLDVSPGYFLGGEMNADNSSLIDVEDKNKRLIRQMKLIEDNFKLVVDLHFRMKSDIIKNELSLKYKSDVLNILLEEVEKEYDLISRTSDPNDILKMTYSNNNSEILRYLTKRAEIVLREHGAYMTVPDGLLEDVVVNENGSKQKMGLPSEAERQEIIKMSKEFQYSHDKSKKQKNS